MDTIDTSVNRPLPGLDPKSAGVMLAIMGVVCAILSVASVLLPHDAYIRYQQLRNTIQFRSQWIYERIELDDTPINVAIIGNSRMEAGVSGPKLQAHLRAMTGTAVNVANLSLPQEGRNIHYVVAKRLLEARPELRLMVISVVEEMPRLGHPAFRNLGDAADVAGAPMLLNLSYFEDLAFLPYRQISLWAQSQAPKLFGVTRTLSDSYPGSSLDTTKTFILPGGQVVSREEIVSEKALMAGTQRTLRGQTPRVLPASLADYEYAMERTYTHRICKLAQSHGVEIVFLHLPIFGDYRPVGDQAFYTQCGQILRADFLAKESTYFADYGHLNRFGSAEASIWLAQRLVSMNLVEKTNK